MENKQLAFTFDKVTLTKIGKGFLIAMTGGAVLGAIDYLQIIDITNPLLAQLVVVLTPTIINSIKEWMKGELR